MEKLPKIQLSTALGIQLIDPHQIISVCPENRKSIIYIDDATKILAYSGIEEMERLLDYPFFFRCHRNCIINLLKISTINIGYYSLLTVDSKEIFISKHRKNDFKKVLALFCKSYGDQVMS